MQLQLPQMQQMVLHHFLQQHKFIVQIHPQFVVPVAQPVYAQSHDKSISHPLPQVHQQPVAPCARLEPLALKMAPRSVTFKQLIM